MGLDDIRFARCPWISRSVADLGHALRNTLVRWSPSSACSSGRLIAFSIVTETVFQWPGMGQLFIQAVMFADIPVMAAYLCLMALAFAVINGVVDVRHVVIDPRLRVARGSP